MNGAIPGPNGARRSLDPRLAAPLTVGAWLIRVLVAALAGQILYWALGTEGTILASGGGRSFVMIFALLVTLAFVGSSAESLKSSGFGLARTWRAHLVRGAVIGVASVAIYLMIALATGALSRTGVGAGAVIGGVFEGSISAPFVAVILAVVIPGWLFGELRRGWSAVPSVAATSVLGAGMIIVIEPELILADGRWGRLPTLVLAIALLASLRQRTGNILLPCSILTGWLIVLRSARKADLLAAADRPDALALIFAPGGDALGAPAIWTILGVGVFVALAWPTAPPEAALGGLESRFKRMQLLAHMGILAPIDVWVRVLHRTKWSIDPIYWPRLLALLVSGTLSAIITLPERLIFRIVSRRLEPVPPVMILGMHRSGTTFLQNLLALDPQFASPRTRHVLDPFGFLVTGWLIAPLLWAVLPLRRPQDRVRFGLFSPNEEEYALANMCPCSPEWSVRLPRERAEYDRFLFSDGFGDDERAAWSSRYREFLIKLTIIRRRTPLLKNPFNTGRLSMLSQTFEGARFIHIHRDPFAVYRSYMHLIESAHPLFQLQEDPDESRSGERFCDVYRRMEQRFYADVQTLPAGRCADVSFEELESDPAGQIRRIYDRLGLQFSQRFERRLHRYLARTKSYLKNVYPSDLPEAERVLIETKLASVIERRAPVADRAGSDSAGQSERESSDEF